MKLEQIPEEPGTYRHYCPGCKSHHLINTLLPNRKNALWRFDGNMHAPTFTPSVNISCSTESGILLLRCHYFIKSGKIEYLNDCTHDLKGKIVDLPVL